MEKKKKAKSDGANMTTSPQIENGHTDISNELLDFLCSFRIPGECRQVFDAVMRKTWGWHKKEDFVSGSQITELTKMKKGNVSRALSKLVKNKLVIKSDNKLRINKNYLEWIEFGVIKSDNNKKLSKVITTVIKSDNKKLSEVRDTKEKKETIQKKGDLKAEAFEWLEVYKEVRREPKRKSVESFLKNFIIWRKTYSLEEMVEALQKIRPGSFHDQAMNPDYFFRTRNKNGECDYIGDLLSQKTDFEKSLVGENVI